MSSAVAFSFHKCDVTREEISASQRCNHTKQRLNNDATLYCGKNTVVSNQSCLNVIGRNKSQIRGNLLAGPGILVHDI